MSNENEVGLDTGKQNDPKLKVERKEGEPTSAFKGASWAAISLQKAVRDKDEEIPVTAIYYGISWFAFIVSIALMGIVRLRISK